MTELNACVAWLYEYVTLNEPSRITDNRHVHRCTRISQDLPALDATQALAL